MRAQTKTQAQLATLVFMMINAVLFGIGVIAVLTIPATRADAGPWIVAVVIASVLVSAPVSWLIAPRLRLRYWKQRAAQQHHASLPQHG
ncbi:MAG TPA: hypothetical protein VG986_15010 [Pseudolabrys sp.]|nr:hypothetical protein [Pseudolabrys sp.]